MSTSRTELAKAGLIYGSALFAAGFAMAIPRELWLKSWLGESGAILVELPIVLSFGWWLSAVLMRGDRSGWRGGERLAMGAAALLCLLLTEAMLGILAFGQSVPSFLATFLTFKGLAGLAAQALACCFPLLQMKAVRS
jgi:hypothetical protein